MKKIQRKKYCHSPEQSQARPFFWWPVGDEAHKREWTGGVWLGAGASRELVMDFGREVGGRLWINWGRVRGGPVRFYFSESLEELFPDGDVEWTPLPGVAAMAGQHTYSGRGGRNWRDRRLRGGFRYVLVRAARGVTALLHDVRVELDFYVPPNGRYPGGFDCSDERLTRIWYGAAYTMQVSTKRPWESFVGGTHKVGQGDWVIFDGAKRDRIVWNMDLALCAPGYLMSLGNPGAVKDSLLTVLEQKGRGLFALRPDYIPHSAFPLMRPAGIFNTSMTFSVYVLWWIRCVVAYYLHTGDDVFAREMLAHVREGLDWFRRQCRPSPQSGASLFFANGLNDLSWDYTVHRVGFSGATNLMYMKTLEETAWLIRNLGGDDTWRKDCERGAADVRKAMFDTGFKPYNLFDEKRGRFRHTTLEDTPLTLEVNALAVLFGLLKGKRAHRALDLLRERMHVDWGSLCSDAPFPLVLQRRHNNRVMPSLVAYEVAALAKMKRCGEALDLARQTWLPMLEQGSGSTYWEWYGDNGRAAGSFASLCHPWSANILEVLNSIMTGLHPCAPGCEKFILTPTPAYVPEDIGWCRCDLATPRGAVRVQWKRRKNGDLRYRAELPDGVRVVPDSGKKVRATAAGKSLKGKPLKKEFDILISREN